MNARGILPTSEHPSKGGGVAYPSRGGRGGTYFYPGRGTPVLGAGGTLSWLGGYPYPGWGGGIIILVGGPQSCSTPSGTVIELPPPGRLSDRVPSPPPQAGPITELTLSLGKGQGTSEQEYPPSLVDTDRHLCKHYLSAAFGMRAVISFAFVVFFARCERASTLEIRRRWHCFHAQWKWSIRTYVRLCGIDA